MFRWKFVANFLVVLPSFVILNVPSALARQWVRISDNDNVAIFVDVDSIKGEGETRTFWSKTFYAQDRYQNGYYFRSITSLLYVECRNEKMGTIRSVFYNNDGMVVRSFDNDNFAVVDAQEVVPDSVGELQLRYVCSRRTLSEGITPRTGTPNSSRNTTSLTKEQAIELINGWLRAKREIFAPPYSQRRIEELTTGSFRQELLSASGPINWLKNNNAWYKYDTQTIEQTRSFSTSKSGKAIIELRITEYLTYYQNSRIRAGRDRKTTNVRYHLELSDGRWKIGNYTVIP